MTPSIRAGGTVDPDVDSTRAPFSNGHGGGAHSVSDASAPSGNGNGNGAGTTQRRRTTLTNGVPMPERGTASSRGVSSSSISKASVATAEPAAEDAPSISPPVMSPPTLDAPLAEASPSSAAADHVVLPATGPEAPDKAASSRSSRDDEAVTSPKPALVDDESIGDKHRPPMVDESGEIVEIEPLPLPTLTPAVEPASRGSVPLLPDPTWIPSVPPDVPLEPPYVTTTSMTSHKVAPVPRMVGRRPRVRKVTRVVRHVDPWSVFKIALVFNLVLYGVLLTAGVLLWNVAYATGTIDNIERFFESFGWSEFEFNGGAIYHSAWIAGLFGVVGLTGAVVLAATLFNLITDLVGGVRMTVLEEEVVERTAAPMRRFVVRRTPATETNGDIDPQAASDEAQTEENVPVRTEPSGARPASLDDRLGL